MEFVAPFLAKFHGSKCFIYKWNGLKQKIRDHYLSPEYQAYGLKVYDFTLETIVSCILREEPGKKIVFLQTASLAYAFGQYQRKLLQSLADLFPDRVHGVTAVGHCLYGCMSCSVSIIDLNHINDVIIRAMTTEYPCISLGTFVISSPTLLKQYASST